MAIQKAEVQRLDPVDTAYIEKLFMKLDATNHSQAHGSFDLYEHAFANVSIQG